MAARHGHGHRTQAAVRRAVVRVLAAQVTQVGPRLWRVPSASHPGISYLVRAEGGALRCSCPGHAYRGRCKHADAVRLARGRPSSAAA